jgi:pimeloyl-ACP methyl ester carboxylesterase
VASADNDETVSAATTESCVLVCAATESFKRSDVRDSVKAKPWWFQWRAITLWWVALTQIERITKLLGRGEIKVIEGADHMTTLTKPEFARAIEEFLRANRWK